MKTLLFKITLFIFPILIVFSYPLFIMQMAGEFTNVDQILNYQNQSRGPSLILTAYSDPWSYVKLKSVQNNHPDVLVLGTSRVMQFRSKFFQTSFYNASRGISDLRHLNTFLSEISKKYDPKVIILGLDPYMLNPNWTFSSTEEMYRKPSWKEWLRIFGKNWSQLYRDQLAGKIHMREVLDEGKEIKKIGLLARAGEEGFSNDGSFLYGDYIKLSALTRGLKREILHKKAIKQIHESKGVYVSSNEISEEKLATLETFLREASKRNIHVVAYLPPFAPAIYKELLKNQSAYLWKLHPRLEPVFHKYGHRIFDFQNPFKLDASDDDFVDDVHDAGRVTLNIFLKMTQSDPYFKNLTSPNIDRLKNEDLWAITNPYKDYSSFRLNPSSQ